MPLLYRNVVPNVPLWTAGNGRLVFRDAALSARAAMTYSLRIHGTVEMDGAIADAGLQVGAIDLTLSSSMPDYGSGTIEEWGGYDVALQTPAVTPDPVVWPRAEYIFVGNTTSPVGGSTIRVRPYPESFDTVSAHVTTDTYIVLPREWNVGHTWDARLGNATWFASPTPVWVSDNVFDAYMDDSIVCNAPKYLNNSMTLAVCHRAYTTEGDTYSFYWCIGGVIVPDDFASVYAACRYDAESPWPIGEKMRLGTDGITLERVASSLDYDNISTVDASATLKAAYAA